MDVPPNESPLWTVGSGSVPPLPASAGLRLGAFSATALALTLENADSISHQSTGARHSRDPLGSR